MGGSQEPLNVLWVGLNVPQSLSIKTSFNKQVNDLKLQPGFIFSIRDSIVLVAAFSLALYIYPVGYTYSILAGFVVAHFFLFCNIVRMSRRNELIWSAVFLCLNPASNPPPSKKPLLSLEHWLCLYGYWLCLRIMWICRRCIIGCMGLEGNV